MFDTIDVMGVIAGEDYCPYLATNSCLCRFCLRLTANLTSFIVCSTLFLFFEFFGPKALYSTWVVGGVLFRVWLLTSKPEEEPRAASLQHRVSYTPIEDVVVVASDPGYDRRTARYLAVLGSMEATRATSWATVAAAAA
mmetsp:Transcript_30337/g.71532  ORF Transcript_30337/g.71532 Transcript_30337/m.71532 type:complete len:139 (+) Transcript_30337:189-605(+)